MKRRLLILGALIAFISTFSAGSVLAQRRVSVGGHFYGGGARVAVGAHFGGGYYYRPRVYHYYPRPYVRAYYPYYYPIGFRLGVLPYGFMTFGTAWGPYYYYDGTFYRPTDDKEYEVAEPPVGADVPSLPSGAKEVTIDGNTYYEYKGTIYQEVIKQNQRRYAIVGKDGQLNTGGDNDQAPSGTQPDDNIISELPRNSRKVEIHGETMYVSPDGMYYQEERDANNNVTGYRIVGKESAD
ncbi:MAG TPA: DUF6515 family protein [Chitinophaga sp.]